MTPPRHSATALALLTVLALGACGGEDEPVAEPTTSASPEPTEEPTRSEDSPESSASAGADGPAGAPAGTEAVLDAVAAAVPSGWDALDPQRLGGSGGPQARLLADIAERLGTTPDALSQQLQNVSLIAVSDERPVGGVVTNLNALTVPGTLPGTDETRREIEAVADRVGDVEEIDVPLGPAQRAAFSVTVGDQRLFYQALVVDTGDGALVNTTVTAGSAAAAADVADRLQAGFESAG